MGERRRRKSSLANESKTNVRDIASSFIGRTADIAAIAARLEGGRLVTIVGPGGMGKTRVALRFAEEQGGAHSAPGSGGTWFCDFTEARTVAGIVAVVAAALDVRLPKTGTDAALVEDMGIALARKGRVLLLFDNFEHLVSKAEGTLGRWITDARQAKFVVTSRAALNLSGEALWPMEPLPPDEARLLFLRRAAQVRPDVAGAGREQEAVISEIVEAIGGMPLAIELAASRTAILSLAQLRDRLERPLELLATPGQPSGRHASLRGTVLDSVQLLSPAERAAFAACAIFGGGFTLEAAEAILSSPDAETRAGKGAGALASIEALVRHSLLRAVPTHRLGGELRFSFFETIRAVAAELLREDAAQDGVASRHARFYAELARKLAPDAAIRGGGEAFVRIELELENLVH
ncbi:MAG TPA: AAA family ATPase, partial [Polyangiaceae bacterium]